MTEKKQTLHGYIIRILQHFATKLRNITNFVMLIQAVMNLFVQACLDQNFTHKGKGLFKKLLVFVCVFYANDDIPFDLSWKCCRREQIELLLQIK